jgi:hypothetical protein
LAAQVADRDFDVDARSQSLNSLPHVGQTRFISPGEDQGQPALGELLGEQCAEARARARDDRPALLLLRHFRTFRRCRRR